MRALEGRATLAITTVARDRRQPILSDQIASGRGCPMSDDGQKVGWFARLRQGLSRSSSSLKEQIVSVVARRRLDEAALEELEEALITADLGVETSAMLVKGLAKDRFG